MQAPSALLSLSRCIVSRRAIRPRRSDIYAAGVRLHNFHSSVRRAGSERNAGLVQEMRRRLQDDPSDQKQGWEEMWKEGVTPWDLGRPTPALVDELLQLRERERGAACGGASMEGKTIRTLIPGCGAGHDLSVLADHLASVLILQEFESTGGGDGVVVGLDLSHTSLGVARDNVQGQIGDGDGTEGIVEVDEHGRMQVEGTRVHVELLCGDFFATDSEWNIYGADGAEASYSQNRIRKDDKFDLIYDYTFFCSLPPAMRTEWGRRMSQLLRPGSGRLLTLIFPIPIDEDAEEESAGPPYPVSVEDYRSVLEPQGFQALPPGPYESRHTVKQRVGRELVCWWTL